MIDELLNNDTEDEVRHAHTHIHACMRCVHVVAAADRTGYDRRFLAKRWLEEMAGMAGGEGPECLCDKLLIAPYRRRRRHICRTGYGRAGW